MTFYTYIYYDPNTNIPFFVGKGQNKRAWDHLRESIEQTDNPHKVYKIQKLLREDTPPLIYTLKGLTEDEAYELEAFLIEHWGRRGIDENGLLLNIIPGGRGGWAGVPKSEDHKRKIGEGNKLASQTPETKERKSDSHKGSKNGMWGRKGELNPQFGIPKSEETKAKLSIAAKERLSDPTNHPMYGRRQSEESKAKNRKWHLGRKMPASMSEKMSILQTGKKRPQSTKDRIADALADNWLITFPDGHTETHSNLNKFCREYNVGCGNMVNVSKGKLKQTKGFKCSKISS